MALKLSNDTVLVGFYTKPTQLPSNRRVSPQVKVWAVVPQRAELNPHGARPGGGTCRGIARADFGSPPAWLSGLSRRLSRGRPPRAPLRALP